MERTLKFQANKWPLPQSLARQWKGAAASLTETLGTYALGRYLQNIYPSKITVKFSEGKIKRSLVNCVRLVETMTKMVTGCLRTMKSCHFCIRWLKIISSYLWKIWDSVYILSLLDTALRTDPVICGYHITWQLFRVTRRALHKGPKVQPLKELS